MHASVKLLADTLSSDLKTVRFWRFFMTQSIFNYLFIYLMKNKSKISSQRMSLKATIKIFIVNQTDLTGLYAS